MDLSGIFSELGMLAEMAAVPGLIRALKGCRYQRRLHDTMIEIVEGDMACANSDYEGALAKFGAAYAELGSQYDYSVVLLTDRLRNLRMWVVEMLPYETALHWCRALRDLWKQQVIHGDRRYLMLDALEGALSEISAGRKKRQGKA